MVRRKAPPLCFCLIAQNVDETCLLDIGCSNHMIDKGELFCVMHDSYKSKIKLVDDKAIQAEGRGAMEVYTTQG